MPLRSPAGRTSCGMFTRGVEAMGLWGTDQGPRGESNPPGRNRTPGGVWGWPLPAARCGSAAHRRYRAAATSYLGAGTRLAKHAGIVGGGLVTVRVGMWDTVVVWVGWWGLACSCCLC